MPVNSKIQMGSADTFISVDNDNPEDLVIAADDDIFLSPDDNLFLQGDNVIFRNTSNTEFARFDMDGSGGLGIGKTTPTQKLEVVGNISASGNLYLDGDIYANKFHTTYNSSSVIYSSGSTQFGDTPDDTHIFTGTISGSKRLHVINKNEESIFGDVDASGFGTNISSGSKVTIAVSSHASASLKLMSANHYWELMTSKMNTDHSSAGLGFWKNGNEKITFDSDGKVGIGTQTPSQKLHVVGNILATGDIYSTDFIEIKQSTKKMRVTGSLIVSGSSTLKVIGPTEFTGSVKGTDEAEFKGKFTAADFVEIKKTPSKEVLVKNNATMKVTGSLTVSGSNTFKVIGPSVFDGTQQFTGSTEFKDDVDFKGGADFTGSTNFKDNMVVKGNLNASEFVEIKKTPIKKVEVKNNAVMKVTGSLLVSGSNTFIVEGPSQFTGSIKATENIETDKTIIALTGSIDNVKSEKFLPKNLLADIGNAERRIEKIYMKSQIIHSGSLSITSDAPETEGVNITGSLTVSGSDTFKVMGPSIFEGDSQWTGSQFFSGSTEFKDSVDFKSGADFTGSVKSKGNITSDGAMIAATQVQTNKIVPKELEMVIGEETKRVRKIYMGSTIDVSGSELVIQAPTASAAGETFNVIVSGSIVPGDTASGSIGTIDAPFKDLYVQSSSIYFADMSDHGGKSWKQMSKSERLARTTTFHKDDIDKMKRGESLNDSGHISASGDLHIVGSTTLKGQTDIEGETTIKGATQLQGDTTIAGFTNIQGVFKVNGTSINNLAESLQYSNTLRAKGISADEFGYLNNVSSNIQTQMDTKLPEATFNTKTASLDTSIAAKVDTTTFNTKTASIDTSIATKVATSTYNTGLATKVPLVGDSTIEGQVIVKGILSNTNLKGKGWTEIDPLELIIDAGNGPGWVDVRVGGNFVTANARSEKTLFIQGFSRGVDGQVIRLKINDSKTYLKGVDFGEELRPAAGRIKLPGNAKTIPSHNGPAIHTFVYDFAGELEIGGPYWKLVHSDYQGVAAPLRAGRPAGVAFTRDSVTPRVYPGAYLYRTKSSQATGIRTILNGMIGQEITVIVDDANTTFVHGGGSDAGDLWMPAAKNYAGGVGDALKFVFDGASWYCLSISRNRS